MEENDYYLFNSILEIYYKFRKGWNARNPTHIPSFEDFLVFIAKEVDVEKRARERYAKTVEL